MSCSTCRFYFAAEEQCRRNAPAPIGHRQIAQWPKVRVTDWCGQFQHARAGEALPPMPANVDAIAAE